MIPAERGETFGSWSYAPWDARMPGSDARQCLDRGTSQAGECVPLLNASRLGSRKKHDRPHHSVDIDEGIVVLHHYLGMTADEAAS
jgi:hypothetical protein